MPNQPGSVFTDPNVFVELNQLAAALEAQHGLPLAGKVPVRARHRVEALVHVPNLLGPEPDRSPEFR